MQELSYMLKNNSKSYSSLHRRKGQSLFIGALLAAIGGFLDGFVYVGHGHVFANAMTGNVVLLGIDLFSRSWGSSFQHLPPVLAFIVGVFISEGIRVGMKNDATKAYNTALMIEIIVLLLLSFFPKNTNDLFFAATIAFSSAVQVQAFRRVDGKSFNSTFITGNLRKLSEAIFLWIFGRRGNDRNTSIVVDFSTIIIAFLLGAIAGAMSVALGNFALWCPVIVLSMILIYLKF